MRAEDKTKKLERCDNAVVDQLKWGPGVPTGKFLKFYIAVGGFQRKFGEKMV